MPNRQYAIGVGYPRTSEFKSFFITFSHLFFIVYMNVVSSFCFYLSFFRYLTFTLYMYIFRQVAYKMQAISRSFFFVIDKLLSGSCILAIISGYPFAQ